MCADATLAVAKVLIRRRLNAKYLAVTIDDATSSSKSRIARSNAVLAIPVDSIDHPEVALTRCSTPGHGNDVRVPARFGHHPNSDHGHLALVCTSTCHALPIGMAMS
ncbi:hypothetical protein ACP70R_043939 [Stipagrostis hirtigluma subsp. patula]